MRGVAAQLSTLVLASCAILSCTEREEISYAAYDGGGFPSVPRLELPAGAPIGFVSNSYSDTVSVVDLAAGTVLREIRVGRDPVAIDGPHHIAFDGSSLVVALAYPSTGSYTGPHAAHAEVARAGYVQRLSLPDLRVTGEARVDEAPGDIARTNGLVLVSHFDLKRASKAGASVEERRATVAFVDDGALAAGFADATRIPVCAAPHAILPSGEIAFVACFAEDSVAVLDLEAKTVSARIALQGGAEPGAPPVVGPYALSLAKGGGEILVTSTESKDLRVLDPTTRAEVPPAVSFVGVGTPYFPASDSKGRVFVPTQTRDSLVVVDLAARAIVGTKDLTDVCLHPHEAVVSGDETRVFVVCEGDHLAPGRVVALDAITLEIVFSTPVGVYPDKLVLFGGP